MRVFEGVPHFLAHGETGNRRRVGPVLGVLAAGEFGVRSLSVLGSRLLGVFHLPVAVFLVAAVCHALRQNAEELKLFNVEVQTKRLKTFLSNRPFLESSKVPTQ